MEIGIKGFRLKPPVAFDGLRDSVSLTWSSVPNRNNSLSYTYKKGYGEVLDFSVGRII
jgi:hypothetical protein